MVNVLVVGENEFRVAWEERSITTLHSNGKKHTEKKRSYHKRARQFRTQEGMMIVPIYHSLYRMAVGWLEFNDSGVMQINFYPEHQHMGA